MSAEPAPNRSQFRFRVASLPDDSFTVLTFVSRDHRLSGDYHFTIDLCGDACLDPNRVVGQPATLELAWGDRSVPVRGCVARFAWTGDSADGHRYQAELASPLFPLSLFRNSRVFLGKTSRQIAETVLQGDGWRPEQIDFQLRDPLPEREFVVQYDETDLDFLQRLLARDGLFYRFEAGDEKTRLVIHDASDGLPAVPGVAELRYHPRSGTARQGESLYRIGEGGQLLPGAVQVKDYHADTPQLPLEARAGGGGHGEIYRYGDHLATIDQSRDLARRQQQALATRRLTYRAETDCRGLAPGYRLKVSGHPESSLNGDYLIVAVDHEGDQGAGLAYGDQAKGMTYRNTLSLIPIDQPYRPEPPRPRRCNSLSTARIEGPAGATAHLDEQGRYRLRLDLDRGNAPTAQASAPVRMVQPHTGESAGMHFPLHPGTEVLLLFENGDVDRPLIMGALPNPNTISPVTSANASQHILRTKAGNELNLDDRQQNERIDLFTAQKKNLLSLDAKQGKHQVRLASKEGALEARAKKTLTLESGDSQLLSIGNNHEITVENAYRLMTRNWEIELKAAADILAKAGDHIKLTAEKADLELKSGGHLIVDAGEGMSIESRNGDIDIDADGNLNIRASGDLSLLGQSILIEQAGASVEITAGGDILINGKTVSIEGQSIALKGASMGQGGGYSAGGFGGLSGTGVSAAPAGPARPAAKKATPSPGAKTATPAPAQAKSGAPAATAGATTGAAATTPSTAKESQPEKPELVIGMFFDGTGNNMLAEPPGQNTNVAKLRQMYIEENSPQVICLQRYIEGVGTKAIALPDGKYKEEESTYGLATGLGSYGAGVRLGEAQQYVIDELQKYLGRYGSLPDTITFDIFGFSRGAILARHFVNMVQAGLPDFTQSAVQGKPAIAPDLRSTTILNVGGNTLAEDAASRPTVAALYPKLTATVRVRFVGLFDSVGSFFLPGNGDEGFVNPYLSPSSAEFVYQLTARNEIRKNFPLTRILPGGAWKEEETFGAHSDVGGGYDSTPEQIYLTGADVRYTGSGEQGEQNPAWQAEMETRAQKIGAQRGTTCTVRIEGNTAYFFEEKHTKPDLAKVSLKAMHEQATAKGVPLREIEPTDVIPPELAQLVQRAKAGDSAAIRQLKADYIHTSHRPVLTMSDLAHAPEPSGVRTVFPNQPGRAVIGQPVMARSSK